MKEISYKNQFNDVLFGNSWEIESPKKIVLIVTGMAEHSRRYDDFASFLNNKGYSVYCLDHYGQGKNLPTGFPVVDYFSKMIETIHDYKDELEKKFGVDVYIFSHSMGSFITQGYIEKYSDGLKKVIICGTNGRNGMIKLGKALSKVYVNEKNEKDEATLLHNIAIGAYETSIKGARTKNDWLSYNEENVDKYNDDPLCGFRCTNRFYKEFLKGLSSIQKTENIKGINKNTDILLICGEDDVVGNYSKGPISLNNLYNKYGLKSDIIVYKNMRHEILNEKEHQKVYDDVLAFLKNNELLQEN